MPSQTKTRSPKAKIVMAVAALAMLVAFAAFNPWYGFIGARAEKFMSVQEAYEKARKGEIVLVDVRRPKEWRETGVPEPALAITMHQSPITFQSELQAALDGDKTKPLALICARGGRTSFLLAPLEKAGFENLINVAGGMLGGRYGQGWRDAGLPTKVWTKTRQTPQGQGEQN